MQNESPTTDIAVRQNGGAVRTTPEPQVPGLESFGAEDSLMPRLRLVQAQSQFSDAIGKIFNNITNEAKDAVDVVVIGAKKARCRWPDGAFSRDQEPQCASDDAITAREGMAGIDMRRTPTTVCDECVYSQWSTNEKDERVPPACALSYNFLVVDVQDDLPALITFQRTSARAGRTLVTLVRAFGYRRAYRISTKQMTGPSGKFHVYEVGTGEAIIPERLSHYVAMAEQFKDRSIITTDDDSERTAQSAGDTSFNTEEFEQ